MSQLINLNRGAVRPAGNITITCGLVSDLKNGEGKPSLNELQGHTHGTIVVFQRKNGKLLRTLKTGESIGLAESMKGWLTGLDYAVLSVNTRPREVRFQADFSCVDVNLQGVEIGLGITARSAEEVAFEVFHGHDPVLSFCDSFKSQLSRVYSQARLGDIHRASAFTQDLYRLFDNLSMRSELLSLSNREITIVLPSAIADALSGRLTHQNNVNAERRRLELQGIELDWAGVKDPQMRMMLSDLRNRSDTLQRLLDFQMQQAGRDADRTHQASQRKLDMINNFLRGRITDQTSPAEVTELLQLLEEVEPRRRASAGFKILSGAYPSQNPSSEEQATSGVENLEPTRFRIISPTPASEQTGIQEAEGSPNDDSTPSSEISRRPPRFRNENRDAMEGDAL